MKIVQEINLRIKALERQKAEIQNKCSHPGHTRTARANTGNYDPFSDRYWYDCKCTLCEKFWREDQ